MVFSFSISISCYTTGFAPARGKELCRVNNFAYRRTNGVKTHFITIVSVGLAKCEIFRAEVCDFWPGLYNV